MARRLNKRDFEQAHPQFGEVIFCDQFLKKGRAQALSAAWTTSKQTAVNVRLGLQRPQYGQFCHRYRKNRSRESL